MSLELQTRAKAFLARPIAANMVYVSDSIAEQFISAYAEAGKLDLDSESFFLLDICIDEAHKAVLEASGEEDAYLRESAEILQAIKDEYT
jgi:hypothetical protein